MIYLEGGVFGLLPWSLRILSAAPFGGGGKGRCGGGPGGVLELGEGLGIGRRGAGGGTSSLLLDLRSFS